jgi:hypothetical protein
MQPITPDDDSLDDYYRNHPPFNKDDDFETFSFKAREIVDGYSHLKLDAVLAVMDTVTRDSNDHIASLIAGSTGNNLLLTVEDQAKLTEIVRLHDEAMKLALQRDGAMKSADGALSIHFGTYLSRNSIDNPEPLDSGIKVSLYAYVVGSGRNHLFNSIDRALETVRFWYAQNILTSRENGQAA